MIDDDIFWKGVRHIFSPKILTKYELVNIINNVYNLNNVVNKYTTEIDVDKTLSTIYDTNSLFNIPNLLLQIKELKEYNNKYNTNIK